jgi:hypothetical protein
MIETHKRNTGTYMSESVSREVTLLYKVTGKSCRLHFGISQQGWIPGNDRYAKRGMQIFNLKKR